MQQQSPHAPATSPMSACFHRFHVLATSGAFTYLQPPACLRDCEAAWLQTRALISVPVLCCCLPHGSSSAAGQRCCVRFVLPARAARLAYAPVAPPPHIHSTHLHPHQSTRAGAHTQTLTPTSTCAHTTLHCHAACNQAHAVVWARAQLARHRRLPRGAVAPSGGSCCFSLLEAYSGNRTYTPTR